MSNAVKTLWQDESGQSLTEYALIIALVAVALVGVLIAFRGALSNVFNSIKAAVTSA